ncbi:hypothetical protein LZ198_34685 [Myxococcus sp. K15C18031901]|uniref:hypothetical protein n=1 Tax=Myxococcus dinghuensis TaxID=2906761 RepID=UPI0020A81CC4|nr:hypothetical protein [Myxococcus dinghuensis]MCP3104034.1 hypothetical protein [Myxococcus dinghuensis]
MHARRKDAIVHGLYITGVVLLIGMVGFAIPLAVGLHLQARSGHDEGGLNGLLVFAGGAVGLVVGLVSAAVTLALLLLERPQR